MPAAATSGDGRKPPARRMHALRSIVRSAPAGIGTGAAEGPSAPLTRERAGRGTAVRTGPAAPIFVSSSSRSAAW